MDEKKPSNVRQLPGTTRVPEGPDPVAALQAQVQELGALVKEHGYERVIIVLETSEQVIILRGASGSIETIGLLTAAARCVEL